jgi:hypothetical protein
LGERRRSGRLSPTCARSILRPAEGASSGPLHVMVSMDVMFAAIAEIVALFV